MIAARPTTPQDKAEEDERMATTERSVSESAWDAGWAKFEAWLAKHPEVAEEHDGDVCEQIRLWSESPEYAADLTKTKAA